jgi:hypothetical protein
MKLRQNQPLTQPQIFENGDYVHPWYQYLNKPNPPSQEAIEKAKFVDKTYIWSRSDSVRSGNKRSSQ